MAKKKIGTFLGVFLIAVVSFFVVFFLFPDFSNKYFGVSFRQKKETVKPEKEIQSGIVQLVDGINGTITQVFQ